MEIFRTTHDLRRRKGSTKDNGRSPLWIMQKPFGRKIPRNQNQKPHTLLADDDQRLRELRANMRKMPEACSHYPSTSRGSLVDLGTISIHAMVDGHSWTHAQVKAKTILVSFDRFFSQNRSKPIPTQASKTPKSKVSCGETSSADMASHTKS